MKLLFDLNCNSVLLAIHVRLMDLFFVRVNFLREQAKYPHHAGEDQCNLNPNIEGAILPTYIAKKILDVSPFESIDEAGLGQLVTMGCERGRSTRADLHLGVCGEHGGDPASIDFFHRAGLDYVSCSPFRVPIARLAAAQAVIRAKSGNSTSSTK